MKGRAQVEYNLEEHIWDQIHSPVRCSSIFQSIEELVPVPVALVPYQGGPPSNNCGLQDSTSKCLQLSVRHDAMLLLHLCAAQTLAYIYPSPQIFFSIPLLQRIHDSKSSIFYLKDVQVPCSTISFSTTVVFRCIHDTMTVGSTLRSYPYPSFFKISPTHMS